MTIHTPQVSAQATIPTAHNRWVLLKCSIAACAMALSLNLPSARADDFGRNSQRQDSLELVAFGAARQRDSVDGYQQFLRRYPHSRYARTARTALSLKLNRLADIEDGRARDIRARTKVYLAVGLVLVAVGIGIVASGLSEVSTSEETGEDGELGRTFYYGFGTFAVGLLLVSFKGLPSRRARHAQARSRRLRQQAARIHRATSRLQLWRKRPAPMTGGRLRGWGILRSIALRGRF